MCRLIGPEQASRTEVLEHLMLRRYDVLHFAGHCIYDEKIPQLSGWVFGRDQRISAYELNRVDRVPRFVFSNACESGVLSGGTSPYSPGLAPSFAESFFLRGVSNFVCTAWPVDDTAALEFAQWVYYCLLGLRPHTGPGPKFTPLTPMPMHAAMRHARLRIAGQPHGVQTWGAYQHYGNPYLSFFDTEAMKTPPRATAVRAVAPAASASAVAAVPVATVAVAAVPAAAVTVTVAPAAAASVAPSAVAAVPAPAPAVVGAAASVTAAAAPSKEVEPDVSAGLIAALSDSPGIPSGAARQPAVGEPTDKEAALEANPRPQSRSRKKSARSS